MPTGYILDLALRQLLNAPALAVASEYEKTTGRLLAHVIKKRSEEAACRWLVLSDDNFGYKHFQAEAHRVLSQLESGGLVKWHEGVFVLDYRFNDWLSNESIGIRKLPEILPTDNVLEFCLERICRKTTDSVYGNVAIGLLLTMCEDKS